MNDSKHDTVLKAIEEGLALPRPVRTPEGTSKETAIVLLEIPVEKPWLFDCHADGCY